MIPEDDEAHGDGKNQSGDGVDFRSDAKVEGSFLMSAVQLLQAGEEFGRSHGNERRAVTEKNRHQTEMRTGKNGKHQQRKTRNDARKNQGKKHKAAEKSFTGEAGAIER